MKKVFNVKFTTISLIFIVIAAFACEKSAANESTSIVGNWYGDSVCQIKDSPCNTEKVVYRIIQMDDVGKFAIQADKIINEKPEYMGTIEFQYDEASKTLLGKYHDSVWKFTVNGKEMNGTLTLADGRIYRLIKLSKTDCGGKSYD